MEKQYVDAVKCGTIFMNPQCFGLSRGDAVFPP
jgi:hypothetical protein